MNIFILHPQVSHVQFPLSLLSLCISGNADHRRSHSFPLPHADDTPSHRRAECKLSQLKRMNRQYSQCTLPESRLGSTIVVIICEIWRYQKYTQYPMAQSLFSFEKGSGTQNGPKFGWRGVVSCQCQGKKGSGTPYRLQS
jgi:hypothetical protein